MSNCGAYGERLAETFRVPKAPAFVSRMLRRTEIAVTHIKCDIENNGLTAPIPRESAFLISVQMRECPRHELWLDERSVQTGYLRAGTVSIYDLRRNPVAHSVSAFQTLHFYVPQGAFNAIADTEGERRVYEFSIEPGIGEHDPLLQGLGQSILPCFDRPEEAVPLFVEHITVAAAAWTLRRYGVGAKAPQIVKRGLAPSQERRAKEMLRANLDGDVSISSLARECGFPTADFCRAFRSSTGMPPYRWLLHRRIENATDLLRFSRLSVAAVAAASGFANERHFRRIFLRVRGMSPENWRLQN